MNYILISLLVVVVNFSGSNCLEMFYSSEGTRFSTTPHNGDEGWAARGYFNNSINSTGFGYLEIETNASHPAETQAFHAGYLEGSLTTSLIHSHWVNVVAPFCESHDCSTIKSFLKENKEWTRSRMRSVRLGDPYWYQLNLIYLQLSGITRAYNDKRPDHVPEMSEEDIEMMNLFYELPEIQSIIDSNKTLTKSSKTGGSDHCSVLIKIIGSNEDVYFGHNTWIHYSAMLRILKRYIFPYSLTIGDTRVVPGKEISMSSYPGVVWSVDDFYLISSGLAVTETTNLVFNETLFKGMTSEGTVWQGLRAMLANRLATDGETWHEVFSRFNSGTCNNQYMVVDYNKFTPGEPLPAGTLWISEQMPGKMVTMDVTDVLVEEGYWSSYNVPYTDEIRRISGYNEKMLGPDGPWYSYTETPRAKLFKRDHGTVTDMESFMRLMRSNDFRNDSLAVCNCVPAYSGRGAIAAREDLNPEDGVDMNERVPRGAVDAKLTNRQLFSKLQFVAVAGPTTGTHNQLPVFRWSDSSFSHLPHMSHPDEFNFQPFLMEWSLNKTKE
ncbi:putative phospholipase B-like 2 [Nilaparvata lugens]|uniref:putative phospholipase B-like 2 n=1 Tax=Nilaparvata lugens TaxID=108931 RepID=UPI00193CA825|nr:putative phospholipase B-like 2 [Nilaparvata lugens]XP_039285112.1 putative phospholipase B-like 2 [Nilaparvata lugens]